MIEFDPVAIRQHVEMLHHCAAGHAGKGELVVASYGEDPDCVHPQTGKAGCPIIPIVERFPVGHVDGMVEAILRLGRQRYRNVYVAMALVRPDLPPGKKGGEADVVAVLGLVADFDDPNAAAWPTRLPLPADYVIESSAGRFQCFYLFDVPVTVAEAKPLAERLRDFCHSDHGSLDLSHVWRCPGSLNWPNHKKVAEGRAREPQLARVAYPWSVRRTDFAALARALPEARFADVGGAAPSASPFEQADAPDADAKIADTGNTNDGKADTDLDVIWGMLPEKLRNRISNPEPAGSDRSRTLYFVIQGLGKRGLDARTIGRLLRRYPRGAAAKYIGRTDLDKEITRVLLKQSRKTAMRWEAAAARGTKPAVKLIPGMISENIDEAEKYLIASDPELYQRGDFIVRSGTIVIQTAYGRKIEVPGVVPLNAYAVVERFTKAVDFQTFDARSEDWVSINCPLTLAHTYLARARHWHLRPLTAIINRPTLRADGSILETPGYDEGTGVLFDPHGVEFPPIPQFPSKGDALIAMARLKALYPEVPFVPGPRTAEDDAQLAAGADLEGSASRSVALSMILTALHRPTLPAAPLHGFSAPTAGSGKSKLVDTPAVIVSGHEAAVMSPGMTEEEFEKRLGAELLAGSAIISLDNCENPIAGVLLAQALTQLLVKVRILRTSDQPTVPNTAMFAATGNNLRFAGDIPRRAVRCDINAKTEEPWLRNFESEDPVEKARRERPELVVAGLTILRAYYLVRDKPLSRPLGSFVEWSVRVRDALIWLGEPDPCLTMRSIRDDDPGGRNLGAVLIQWELHLGDAEYTVREIIARAIGPGVPAGADGQSRLSLNDRLPMEGLPDLREALLVVAGNNGAINSQRLGNWLGAQKHRILGGRQIAHGGVSHGFQRWKLGHVVNYCGFARNASQDVDHD